MKEFFKTFGLGLLYIILFPFLLIYLIFIGIFLVFKEIYLIFKKLSRSYNLKEDKLKKKADKVLSINKYTFESKNEKIETKDEKNREQIIYNTTNNIVFTSLDDLKKFQNLSSKNPVKASEFITENRKKQAQLLTTTSLVDLNEDEDETIPIDNQLVDEDISTSKDLYLDHSDDEDITISLSREENEEEKEIEDDKPDLGEGYDYTGLSSLKRED